jgi:lipopolysaccharide biosynthesis protein
MPAGMQDELCRLACANESYGGGDLAHYLELRKRSARARHHLTITPFATGAAPALRAIALLHLFHQDQWPEFRERLAALHGDGPQLVVAIPEEIDGDATIAEIKAFDPAAKIVRVANRGFDIGSHWQVLDTIDLSGFDVALLLQTKKSTHTRVGPIWRRNLVDALIGSRSRWLDNLHLLATQPRIGMIGSAWHQTTFHPWTYPAMRDVLRALQMPTRFDEIKAIHEFTAGSMFMIRADLLRQLHVKTRAAVVFESYASLSVARRGDDSLAHAMERAFGLYTRWRGFEIAWRA